MASSMQTLVFPLINRYTRPFFTKRSGKLDVKYMYDTGARIPVWCRNEQRLLLAFPSAEETKYTCKVSGFGKGQEDGKIYKIPSFELSDGKSTLTIRDLYLAVIDKQNIGCDFLISETMFAKTDTHIFRLSKKVLELDFEDRDYFCTANRVGGMLVDISVWVQNENH